MFEVKKAKRSRRPLKIGLEGLSGSGKTFTALRLAFAMRRAGIGKRIVVADSENESAGLYDGIAIDGETWSYEVCQLPPEKQNPNGYTECYQHLVSLGYDIIIIDSMTHAWKGALQKVDEVAARNKNDKFGAGWRTVTPEHEKMLRTLTDPNAHLITTTRVKGEYERVEGAGGRDKIKKVGMKADQRDGVEYEWDCLVRLDPEEHAAVVEKVRGCMALDGKTCKCPGPDFWKPLFDWWLSAEPMKQTEPKQFPAYLDNLKAARNQDSLQEALNAVRPPVWGTFSKAQQDLFLEAKTATAARLEGKESADPTAAKTAEIPKQTHPTTSAKPARSTTSPTRADLGNDVYSAAMSLSKATGKPMERVMQDLSDEYGIGAIDDMQVEQMQAAIAWLGEQMPKDAMFEKGKELVK